MTKNTARTSKEIYASFGLNVLEAEQFAREAEEREQASKMTEDEILSFFGSEDPEIIIGCW